MTTPTTQREADERPLFESWFIAALRRTYPHMPEAGVKRMLSKHDDGTYTDLTTQHDWSVWQASVARASLTPTAPQAASPDGWVLARREPSQEQLDYAAYNINRKRNGPDIVTPEFMRECWSNLLHSRPIFAPQAATTTTCGNSKQSPYEPAQQPSAGSIGNTIVDATTVASPEDTTTASADPEGDFAKGMLIQLSRMGASPAALSLAVQLFGVGPCDKCGFRKLHCRCSPAATTASASGDLRKALEAVTRFAESQICMHGETHRGGAIWEICDQCGAEWADDKGGKPEFKWPAEIELARAALARAPLPAQGNLRSVATVRVTNNGYGMELSTYIAYALPEGMHELYAAPVQVVDVARDAAQPDFMKWWTSIETDVRKSMLVWANRDRERLHSLIRQAFEAGAAMSRTNTSGGSDA
jgi:hypothetical protein